MKRNFLIQSVTPVIAAILLSACGGGETPSNSSAEPKNPVSTSDAPKQESEAQKKSPVQEPVKEISAEEALIKRGKIVWFKCRSCHETAVGRPHKVGPNLNGVLGSNAGVKEGFVFSDAMINSGIVWNDETMDAFIQKPASYIKGTKMAFVGISKESDRIALIAYIKENTK